jgi:hypothetical protein
MRGLDRAPAVSGGFDRLEKHSQAGSRESGHLETLAWSRTAVKVGPIGLVASGCTQCADVPSARPGDRTPPIRRLGR